MPETFADERAVEDHIRTLIADRITTQYRYIYTLKNKKVADIVICHDGENPALFFIEVKYFKVNHNRLGFGAGSGSGYQPEILTRRPAYLETNLRWILSTDREPTPSYLFIPTSTLLKYVAGGEIGEKQNNIQRKIFEEVRSLNDGELADEMCRWLTK